MAMNVFGLTVGTAAFAARGSASVTRVTDHDIRSEYHGVLLAFAYYNYRHNNPLSGRWMGRDFDR